MHAAERLGERLAEAAQAELAPHGVLDRLLRHSHVLNIKGRSYRLRDLEQALSLGG